MPESGDVKGILKRNNNSLDSVVESSPRHLKWDEDNIAITEAGKCATMKITEPKTPFESSIRPESDGENGEGLPELHLDSESEGSQVHFSSGAEWESSEELDSLSPEERDERRRKFKKMRKDHYKMREALKLGRELVESEQSAGGEED